MEMAEQAMYQVCGYGMEMAEQTTYLVLRNGMEMAEQATSSVGIWYGNGWTHVPSVGICYENSWTGLRVLLLYTK